MLFVTSVKSIDIVPGPDTNAVDTVDAVDTQATGEAMLILLLVRGKLFSSSLIPTQ